MLDAVTGVRLPIPRYCMVPLVMGTLGGISRHVLAECRAGVLVHPLDVLPYAFVSRA